MKASVTRSFIMLFLFVLLAGCNHCCKKEDPGFLEFDFNVSMDRCLYSEQRRFASLRHSKDTMEVTFHVDNTGECGIKISAGEGSILDKTVLTVYEGTGSSTVPFAGSNVSSLFWDCFSQDTLDHPCSGRIRLFRKNRHECVTRWGEKDSVLLSRYTTGVPGCDHQRVIHTHHNMTNRPLTILVYANSVGTCNFYVWMKRDVSFQPTMFYIRPDFRRSPTIDSMRVPSSPPPGTMTGGRLTVPPQTRVVFFAGCLDNDPPTGNFCGGTTELYIKN